VSVAVLDAMAVLNVDSASRAVDYVAFKPEAAP
jgi:hypothetical protein